jgi:drug/metabolite transporter (DMT)-like permease
VVIAVVIGAVAAAVFALSAVLQQRAARVMPKDTSLSIRLLFKLFRNPVWLAGIGSSALSFLLEAVALYFGPVAVVQPVIVLDLVFALPLSVRLRGSRLGRQEWLGTAAVVGGLVAFLTAADPSQGTSVPGIVAWAPALGAVALIAAVAVGVGRMTSGTLRAVLLAVAAGTMFGLMSAITKTATTELSHGIVNVLTSWPPYALAVTAILALIVVQSAFQSGPLAASMPILDTLEPLTAAAIGVAIFGESLRTAPLALAFEALGILAVLTGIWTLDRSPVVLRLQQEKPEDAAPNSVFDELVHGGESDSQRSAAR